jgi:hypothetical protein
MNQVPYDTILSLSEVSEIRLTTINQSQIDGETVFKKDEHGAQTTAEASAVVAVILPNTIFITSS